MDNEEMNLAELLKQTVEENQTRKILAILEENNSCHLPPSVFIIIAGR